MALKSFSASLTLPAAEYAERSVVREKMSGLGVLSNRWWA